MPKFFIAPLWSAVGWLTLAGGLTACGATAPARFAYEPEEFDSTTTHTRSYAGSTAQTCEAARRALLSQGYLLTSASSELVTGRKSFQPEPEVHVEFEFRVVCAREGQNALHSIAFASALQDRYSLKKSNNSASVGVGILGSLSLPFSASDEALVKVASETITDAKFYDRFFALIDRYRVFSERAEARDMTLAPPVPPVPAAETTPRAQPD